MIIIIHTIKKYFPQGYRPNFYGKAKKKKSGLQGHISIIKKDSLWPSIFCSLKKKNAHTVMFWCKRNEAEAGCQRSVLSGPQSYLGHQRNKINLKCPAWVILIPWSGGWKWNEKERNWMNSFWSIWLTEYPIRMLSAAENYKMNDVRCFPSSHWVATLGFRGPVGGQHQC